MINTPDRDIEQMMAVGHLFSETPSTTDSGSPAVLLSYSGPLDPISALYSTPDTEKRYKNGVIWNVCRQIHVRDNGEDTADGWAKSIAKAGISKENS